VICFDPVQAVLYVLAALGILFILLFIAGIARQYRGNAPGPDDLGGDRDE